MNNKKILLVVFILMALVQIYVPAKMILGKEKVLNAGKEYKFKTVPIDPTDPFRGKYITLRYEENRVEVENEKDWEQNDPLYVILTTDDEGFAKAQAVSKEEPPDNYLKAKVERITSDGSNKLTIAYPFDRFYMEESKADDAEDIYRESQRDNRRAAYALVNIKEGEAVLKDVLIDGISIRELAKERQGE